MLHRYHSVRTLRASDHRPVVALFTVDLSRTLTYPPISDHPTAPPPPPAFLPALLPRHPRPLARPTHLPTGDAPPSPASTRASTVVESVPSPAPTGKLSNAFPSAPSLLQRRPLAHLFHSPVLMPPPLPTTPTRPVSGHAASARIFPLSPQSPQPPPALALPGDSLPSTPVHPQATHSLILDSSAHKPLISTAAPPDDPFQQALAAVHPLHALPSGFAAGVCAPPTQGPKFVGPTVFGGTVVPWLGMSLERHGTEVEAVSLLASSMADNGPEALVQQKVLTPQPPQWRRQVASEDEECGSAEVPGSYNGAPPRDHPIETSAMLPIPTPADCLTKSANFGGTIAMPDEGNFAADTCVQQQPLLLDASLPHGRRRELPSPP